MIRSLVKNFNSLSIYNKLNFLPTSAICAHRSVSSSENVKTQDYIYKFGFLREAVLVNRIKFQQTLFTALLVPTCAVLEAYSSVPSGGTMICLTIGFFSNMTFYTVGQFFHKMIGIMTLKEDGKTVKISYIGFYGRRLEKEVKITDIGPLPETSLLYPLFTVVTLENTMKLKLHTKFAKCSETFYEIFGESLRK